MQYPIPCVRVILQNSKKEILLLKRANTNYDSGKWCLPGGKIEAGQTAEEACIKELKEETNFNISDINFLFYRDDISKNIKTNMYCITLYFTAKINEELKLNEESSDYRWISEDKIAGLNIAFNQEEVIKSYFKSLNNGA